MGDEVQVGLAEDSKTYAFVATFFGLIGFFIALVIFFELIIISSQFALLVNEMIALFRAYLNSAHHLHRHLKFHRAQN